MFFGFYSVGHHLYDTPSSHCDPPKDPNIHNQLQVANKIKEYVQTDNKNFDIL